MEWYSLLFCLFAIGAFATYKVCSKTPDRSQRSKHWAKFGTYFALVFTQLFAIGSGWYSWFAILVLAFGFYEIWNVGKWLKTKLAALVLFAMLASGYVWFFNSETLANQQFLFVSVIVFDGFSQLSGQLFGRVRLFPKVSPGKTLEGMCGGFLALVACAVLMSRFLKTDLSETIASALLIGIFSIAGDFLASLYKRINHVKDFSRIIPAHGGILDRFDSLIVAGSGGLLIPVLTTAETEIWNCAVYLLAFLGIFVLAELGHGTFRIKTEITRKFVHVSSGLACLSFPFYLQSWISVLALCVGFLALLAASKRFGWLKSVNAIGRKSCGSFVFPIAVFACFCAFESSGSYLVFYLPIVILAVCDPLAALFGKKWAFGVYKVGNQTKTLVGSAIFFISCFSILMGSLLFSDQEFSARIILASVSLSVLATVVEAISRNGYDNLTIPLSVLVFIQLWDFASFI